MNSTFNNSLSIKSTQSKLILLPNDDDEVNSTSNTKIEPNRTLIDSLSSSSSSSSSTIKQQQQQQHRGESRLNSGGELLKNQNHQNLNSNSRSSSSNSRTKKESVPLTFYQQFLTGTGWFSPLVLPLPPPTREEREEKEKERIQKLRENGSSGKGMMRPTLRARASSGVEMMGWEGGQS